MTVNGVGARSGVLGFGDGGYPAPVLCAQDVVVDLNAHLVRVGDRVVVLPPKELRLLALLVDSAGTVVSRSDISNEVWGSGPFPEKSLEVHIRRLRERIEPDPSHPRYIRTVRGFGYIFDTVQATRYMTGQ